MDSRITVRMTPAMLASIDKWTADQRRYVSRQEAVRRCVELAFSQGGPPPIENSRDQSPHISQEEEPSDNEEVFLD